ncbi:MAG: hypothetical protein FWD69_17780 [Polyangiaceae bacterium]|nr:hypothetical protein [Polyangiaceae bacterium]
MTTWDFRSFLRALVATLLSLTIVWLITAASDEGPLAVAIRAGRTLPLAPLAGSVGAALALGTSRVRGETLALEALGRSPAEAMVAAVIGAALPSIVIAMLLAAGPTVNVTAFYPRAPRDNAFVVRNGAFESASLGVRIDSNGELEFASSSAARGNGEDLPRGARGAAAAATALAGIALPLVAARASAYRSLLDRFMRKRRRNLSVAIVGMTSLATLVAFQAAAAGFAPAMLAVLPPSLLLAWSLVAMRFSR